jgi:hypothetical protein
VSQDRHERQILVNVIKKLHLNHAVEEIRNDILTAQQKDPQKILSHRSFSVLDSKYAPQEQRYTRILPCKLSLSTVRSLQTETVCTNSFLL